MIDHLTQRGAISSETYLARGETDLFANAAPAANEFETTKEVVADSVTFRLGEETFVVSALKRGHLTIERTAVREYPPESREHVLTQTTGFQGDSWGTKTKDTAVVVLTQRAPAQGPPTQDPVIWATLQYLRAPLQEIVFKVPRGMKIREDQRRELQRRVEALLQGTAAICEPLPLEEAAVKSSRFPWRKKRTSKSE